MGGGDGSAKRSRLGGAGGGKGKGGSLSKREWKDQKFGRGGRSSKDKRNSAESTDDLSGFNRGRGGGGGKGGGKGGGRGGGRGGGGGRGAGIKKRPGKDARKKQGARR